MALADVHNNSIFSDLSKKVNNKISTGRTGANLKSGVKPHSIEFQFGRTDVSKLLIKNEIKLYTQFSVRDGSESQPFFETRIIDKNRRQIGGESRLFPFRSSLRHSERITKFLISSKGRNFILKQIALQTLNPTLETKVWNPLSAVIGLPFVHINRHLPFVSGFDVKNYSQAISKIPLQSENISRIKYQSPLAFNIGTSERPGLQMANRGRDLIATKRAFINHNPNRYLFPISADGGGLPLSSLPSPREEMEQKIELAKSALKYTKSTGFNQENNFVQNSSNVKNVLTGLLRSLIPEPIRKPMSRILGLLKTSEFNRVEMKIFNNYNITFPYLENPSAIENINPKISGVNESRDQGIKYTDNKSPLGEILSTLEQVGTANATNNIPHTFKTDSQLASRLKTVRDDRVGEYLQSYGEISTKSTLNSLTGVGKSKKYEQDKLKNDTVIYKTYGFANPGAINKESRFHDRVNALDVDEDYSSGVGNNLTDLIPFKFFHINENRFIIFRATFTGINESISPSWNEKSYIGRADPSYTYTGTTRKLNFNFDIHPESAKELAPLWRKINALVGLCYPDYVNLVGGGEYMVAPFVKLTIGDLYNGVPGIIESINVTPDDSGTWEIRQGIDDDGNELSRLPRYIRISVSFALIGNEKYSSTSKFYDYTF